MPESAAAVMKQLHDEHAAALWGYCLSLTGRDHARAEDVVQETMLRAWRNHERLEESHGSVRAWLFTVARNIVIDEWRTKRAQSEVPVADVPDVGDARVRGDARDQADHTDQVLLKWVVADALLTLSADHRAVLVECYFKGASVAEAGRRLGIAEGTVKSRTHYALKALRLALQEMGVGA